jgi:hypothetical protein
MSKKRLYDYSLVFAKWVCRQGVLVIGVCSVILLLVLPAHATPLPPPGCITSHICPSSCPTDAVLSNVRLSGECKGALRRSRRVYEEAPAGFRAFAWEQKRYLDDGTSCRLRVTLVKNNAPAKSRVVQLQETFLGAPTEVIARARTNRHGKALIRFRWSRSRCRYDLNYCAPYTVGPQIQTDNAEPWGCDGV